MLEAFYRTHHFLLEHLQAPIRRKLMDEINFSDRLIAVRGCRGVGKTTFLLAYAKEHFGYSQECLYVNFNNFYFTHYTLVDFAAEFVAIGGRVLLLDQVFKYVNWSHELRECYDRFPNLHIVFAASPVMDLLRNNPELQEFVQVYNLRGLSFREYMNLQSGQSFPAFALKDIMGDHENIARQIVEKVNPLWYFPDYLNHGYYPFFLEKNNYSEMLLKTMNMMLEVDILLVKQIDITYLQKIRGLLYRILEDAPCSPNISELADMLQMSRATVINYLRYLHEARLINELYQEGKDYPTKPAKIYMQNTNLCYALPTRQVEPQAIAETFFYNAFGGKHIVNATEKQGLFVVDKANYFNVSAKASIKPTFRMTAMGDIPVGDGNRIPLWLFGFLY